MNEIKAIIRPDRLFDVLRVLHAMPSLPGVTVSTVHGFGRRRHGDVGPAFDQVDMTKLEIVVPEAVTEEVLAAIERTAHTGQLGDGKIFVVPVAHAVRIRSGERDMRAL